MTTTDPTRILVPSRAYVYLGEVGTTAPADVTTALDPGFIHVGLTDPESLNLTTEPEFEEVLSHQSDYPVRKFQTSDAATLGVNLQEWSGRNFKSVFGGGAVTQVSAGVYKYVPPTIGNRQEVAGVVEVRDGIKVYRWVLPRCFQEEGVELELQKTANSNLPLALSILGGDAVDPWYILTNDPAFTPDPPTIALINPNTGAAAGGDTVTITGTNLSGVTQVDFDATPGTNLTIVSDTELTVDTPAGAAGPVDVVLTYGGGTVTETDGFTYA